MLKIGKVGTAIVMGLLLSLTLLASGAFADDTTTAQNSASSATRVALLTVDIQRGTQQVLPTSNAQQLKATQENYGCRGRNCRVYRRYYPRRFYHRVYRRYYPRRFYHRVYRRYYPRRFYHRVYRRYYPRRFFRRSFRQYYPRRSFGRYGRYGR